MESVFLTQNQQNKDDYLAIINNVAKAITETFVDGKAYAGPMCVCVCVCARARALTFGRGPGADRRPHPADTHLL